MAKKTRSFSLDKKTSKKLDEIAQREQRSVSNTLSTLIIKYLEENASSK